LISLEVVKSNPDVQVYLKQADDNFATLGYKDHGYRHAQIAASVARNVLKYLGHSEEEAELAAIAAYLHDIGHALGNQAHAQTGAVLAFELLARMNFPTPQLFSVMNAIGCHEDKTSEIPSRITAATIPEEAAGSTTR